MQFLDNEYLIAGKDIMINVDVSVYCRILRRPEKLERNLKLAFSWLSLVCFSMKNIYIFRESVIKNVWEVTIVNNEIECANRIVYEPGTHKAVAVSARAGECFISVNEVSRMP